VVVLAFGGDASSTAGDFVIVSRRLTYRAVVGSPDGVEPG
jgi:hypothetical protein